MKYFFKIVINSISLFAILILIEIISQMLLYSNVKEYPELCLGLPFLFLEFSFVEQGIYKYLISFENLILDFLFFGILTTCYHSIKNRINKKTINNT